MGLSNMLQGGGAAGAEAGATPASPDAAAPAGGATTAPEQKSFGDKLGDYFKSRCPIAGGLAGMVFDPNQNQQTAPAPAAAVAPQAQILPGDQPDYTQMIAMNAQPQQGGGGLGAILKLIGL